MLREHDIPLLEYDDEVDAIINPSIRSPLDGMPKVALLAYLDEAVRAYVEEHKPPVICELPSITGNTPVYEVQLGSRSIAMVSCDVGGPLAAGYMEELHALGCAAFLSFGGVGVLRKELPVTHMLLPERALRDEGTSYHYLPPSRFVEADARVLAQLERSLASRDIPYDRVTAWTTDAFFRETREKMARRLADGCDCVEMEVATYMAVARFRGIPYGALLFGGDNLDAPAWDNRAWTSHEKLSHLLDIALSCAGDLYALLEEDAT